MALSAGKQARPLVGGDQDYAPQKGGTEVFAGGIVMLDTSGRALPGAAGTGNIGVGVAKPNRGLPSYVAVSDGDNNIQWDEGIFCVKNSGSSPFLSSDQPGLVAYIEDDETVCKTGTGKSPAGYFHHLDADGVWVKMSKELGAIALVFTTAVDVANAHLAGSETFTGVKTFASGADPLFAKEAAHTLKVADTTTAATAGGALTVAAGKSGTTGAGGALSLLSGAGTTNADGGAVALDSGAPQGSGVGGVLSLGATSASAITFGRATKIITRQGLSARGAATDLIADPGNAGAIPVTADGCCAMTSGGSETRTIAAPTYIGQRISLIHDVDGGAIAVTSATAINQTGNTIMTFTEVKDACTLECMQVAGTKVWRIVYNDGVALS